jgi:hypothetical protein
MKCQMHRPLQRLDRLAGINARLAQISFCCHVGVAAALSQMYLVSRYYAGSTHKVRHRLVKDHLQQILECIGVPKNTPETPAVNGHAIRRAAHRKQAFCDALQTNAGLHKLDHVQIHSNCSQPSPPPTRLQLCNFQIMCSLIQCVFSRDMLQSAQPPTSANTPAKNTETDPQSVVVVAFATSSSLSPSLPYSLCYHEITEKA